MDHGAFRAGHRRRRIEVRARYRETLGRMLQLMADADNVEIVLKTLLDLVKTGLNAQACVMFSSDPDRRWVTLQAATGWRAEDKGPISLNPALGYVLTATARQSLRACVRGGRFRTALDGPEERRTSRLAPPWTRARRPSWSSKTTP
jgi:signal transduction protein with GAF and PtsI domain